MVIPSAKSTEVHSMLKVKNSHHFGIQTVFYLRMQGKISLLYFDDQHSVRSGRQERNTIWDFKKQTEP